MTKSLKNIFGKHLCMGLSLKKLWESYIYLLKIDLRCFLTLYCLMVKSLCVTFLLQPGIKGLRLSWQQVLQTKQVKIIIIIKDIYASKCLVYPLTHQIRLLPPYLPWTNCLITLVCVDFPCKLFRTNKRWNMDFFLSIITLNCFLVNMTITNR